MIRLTAFVIGAFIGSGCAWLGNPPNTYYDGGVLVVFLLAPMSGGVAALVAGAVISASPRLMRERLWLFGSTLFAQGLTIMQIVNPCIPRRPALIEGLLDEAPYAFLPTVASCVVWLVVVELIWVWGCHSRNRPTLSRGH